MEDYYKLDPEGTMEGYQFGMLYIDKEDKYKMIDVNNAFDCIPDENNTYVKYYNYEINYSSVKSVKFFKTIVFFLLK